MDNVSLIDVVKRSWAVLLVATVLFAAAGYAFAARSAPTYQGTASLLVGVNSSDAQSLQAAGQLGRTYADLATTRPVLAAAIKAAGLHETVQQVLNTTAVSTSSNDVTRIVVINANAGTPQAAARFANAIAAQLQGLAAQTSSDQAAAFQQFANTPAVATAPAATRQQVLAAARTMIGAASAARLTAVNPATPPLSPSAPKKTLTALLAGIVGLLLVGIILLIREASGARRLTDERELDELGLVSRLGTVDVPRQSDAAHALPVLADPQAPTAARYRDIATNVAWLANGRRFQTLLVLSPDDETHAGVVAANLATVLSEASRRVVLIDAGRDENMSNLFELGGEPGFGEVLEELRTGGQLNGSVDQLLVPFNDALDVLPRGTVSGRTMLDASTLEQLRHRLLRDADVLVVAAPPLGRSPAALAWARTADASLLVVSERHTARTDLERALTTLGAARAQLVGTVYVRAARSRLRRRRASAV